MSLLHNIMFAAIAKNKKRYDPNRWPDFNENRQKDNATPVRTPPKGVTVCNKVICGCNTEWVEAPGNSCLIYLIHGGGFSSGSVKQMREVAYHFVKRGFNVVSVDYRLAPEHPFPQGAEDCFRVYCELIDRYAHDSIAIFGGSAGANLALSTLLRAKDMQIPLPGCVVAIAPPVAFDADFPSHTENVATDCMLDETFDAEIRDVYLCSREADVLRDPYAAPYYGDWHGVCPICLSVSDSEVLRDDSIYLAEKLRAANVTYELKRYAGKMHTFQLIPVLPEAKKALKEIEAFIKAHLCAASKADQGG